MKAVLWGKLLMNLNNALVALSGLPLASELADRRWRLILAGQIDEALAAMKASGIAPARIAGLRPGAAAETAQAAGLAVQADSAAHACHRPAGALIDVGRSSARPADGDRRVAGRGSAPRRKSGHAGAALKRHRAGAQAEREKRGSPGLTPEDFKAIPGKV